MLKTAVQGSSKAGSPSQQFRVVRAMAPASSSTGHAIKLIASDVDGTLLNHRQELTDTVERAVRLAGSVGVQVSALASAKS